VERGTILDDIVERISTPASRVALVGLGGVGSVHSSLFAGRRTFTNTSEANPNSLLNFVTESDSSRQINGFSGYMPAMLLDLSKVSGRLQITSGYQVAGSPGPTSFN
jgi:hypothetical protein